MTKALLLALAGLAGAVALPAAPAAAQSANQKVLVIFGNDRCPTSSGQEIVVCVRRSENERYRIPKELRAPAGSPDATSWAQNAKSLEYVGAAGPMSCSTAGPAGASGCFDRFMAQARAERRSGQQ